MGTELLLGQVVDTNSACIGEQLALAGIDCHFQTRVGDNHGRIVSALRIALDRTDAVIVCGGLGPTSDDVTREAIAEVMGVPLERDAAMVERIRGSSRPAGGRWRRATPSRPTCPAGRRSSPRSGGRRPG